ncbi:MAG: DUF3060 domain-containing protein [Acidobacteria bacterium]|nr:DUF3060 domain-containing protein [Acidobacteriota bacterium]
MMKPLAFIFTLTLICFAAGCDPQSGMTKKGLEKYNPSPTPEIKKQVEEPIDPADVINVETAESGPTLVVNRERGKEPLNCGKYNRVTVNGDGYTVEIKGSCKQLMINGDRNKINGGAFAEIVFNGEENEVKYYKYANGKRPIITQNAGANIIEKSAPPEPKK